MPWGSTITIASPVTSWCVHAHCIALSSTSAPCTHAPGALPLTHVPSRCSCSSPPTSQTSHHCAYPAAAATQKTAATASTRPPNSVSLVCVCVCVCACVCVGGVGVHVLSSIAARPTVADSSLPTQRCCHVLRLTQRLGSELGPVTVHILLYTAALCLRGRIGQHVRARWREVRLARVHRGCGAVVVDRGAPPTVCGAARDAMLATECTRTAGMTGPWTSSRSPSPAPSQSEATLTAQRLQ